MNASWGEQRTDLFEHVLLLAGTEVNVAQTAEQLSQYQPDTVTAVYVIREGSRSSDIVPVEKKKERADDIFETVRGVFPDAESEIIVSNDLVDAILDTRTSIGASVIVYQPRPDGRAIELLSKEDTVKLVSNSNCPILSLPLENPHEVQ